MWQSPSAIVASIWLFVTCPIVIVAGEETPCNGVAKDLVDYELRPLKLGAEISKIDLKEHVDDKLLFERIKSDAHRHRLLVIRNQGEIPAESLLAMSEHFGSLFMEPFTTQTNDLVNHQKAPSP